MFRMMRALGLSAVTVAAAGLTLGGVVAPAQALTCGQGQLQNGSFEAPVLASLVQADIMWDSTSNIVPGGWFVWPGDGTSGWAVVASLPGTNTATSQTLAWSTTEGGVELQNVVTPAAGAQYAEITGLDVNNTLYQTIDTVPGTVMSWSLSHRGLSGTDVMSVRIGSDLAHLVDQSALPDGSTTPQSQISDGPTWRTWTGTYVVPAGQTSTVFGFHGVSTSGGDPTVGNYLDDIKFVCNQGLSDVEGGGGNGGGGGASGPDASGAELSMTGMTVAGLVSVFVVGAILLLFATGTFGARGRLRAAAVDTQVAEQLARIRSSLASMENRYRRHRQRRKF